MRVVHTDAHRLHAPEHDVTAGVAVPQVETPARIEHILQALKADGWFTIESPTEHGVPPIEAVHAPGLIAFLRDAWQTWSASNEAPEYIPDTILHPGMREGMETPAGPEPRDPTGRIGYWCFDTGTPIVADTYMAARGAVDVALTAADLMLAGDNVVYGLCRPPGHHAARSMLGGFCYFNNAAICAEYLVGQTGAKVAVLDLDYHHGNGTQQIFYHRPDVLYVSLHGDPMRAYPYFTGFASETGAGDGTGTTLNIPLPHGTGDAEYLSALDRALEAVTTFAPSMCVVSLGVDTYVDDPLGDFALTTTVYFECGRRVARAARPIVVLQEGGYFLPTLGENVRQFLLGTLS